VDKERDETRIGMDSYRKYRRLSASDIASRKKYYHTLEI